MFCSIYKITNKINSKVYIGQTWKLIRHRFSGHKQSKHCIKLYSAIQKYGANNFNIELITFCSTQETADYLESYFISKYDSINTGYNLKGGGSHGKTSEETKVKLSKALKGRPAINKGVPATPETIAKLSAMRRGVKKSYSHKENMKLAQNDPERIARRSAIMRNKTWKLIDGVRVYSNKILLY